MPKPNGRHAINVHNGKISHILLRKKNNFPIVGTDAGQIKGAIVVDNDNSPGFDFTATPIHQGATPTTPSPRLALRLVSNSGIGGGGPVDGVLTITIILDDGSGGNISFPTNGFDVPVDYVDDPSAP